LRFLEKKIPLKLSLLRCSRLKSATPHLAHTVLDFIQIGSLSYCRTREGPFCHVEYLQYGRFEPTITKKTKNEP